MANYTTGKSSPYPMLLFLSGLVALLMTGCAANGKPVSQSGFYFDTFITITLYETSVERQKLLFDGCFSLAADYDALFSKTREGSDVDRINQSGGKTVTVSAETIALLEKACFYAQLSDGVLDPTIGSVSSLWNFSENTEGTLPSPSAIAEGLSYVDYRTISIDRNRQTITLSDPKAQIDLGFIAKGYIADRLKEYLTAKQVTCAMINLGGNVVVFGSKPDGSPFRVGIQKPFAPTGTAALVLPLTNRSAVSSGNYERYFRKEGVLYHHILDSSTGYPVENDLSSVTILSEKSVDGDALSTLVFLLGKEKGKRFLENFPDISAVFITKDNQQITVPEK